LKSWFTPLLFSLLFYLPTPTLAAPCCGANLTIPSIITSEDKAQVSLSYTYSKIYADVFTNQNWKKRTEDDLTHTFKLDGAHMGSRDWNHSHQKWTFWDANLNSEMHYSFPKNTKINNQQSTLIPSYGGNVTLGGGANWEKWRLGFLAGWFYEGPVTIEGDINSTGELKRFTNAGVMLSYMFTTNQSFILNYTDQTLLASPYNTSLNKSLTLFYQLRWER